MMKTRTQVKEAAQVVEESRSPAKKISFCNGVVFFLDRGLLMGAP
jgi:hypothetical protein